MDICCKGEFRVNFGVVFWTRFVLGLFGSLYSGYCGKNCSFVDFWMFPLGLDKYVFYKVFSCNIYLVFLINELKLFDLSQNPKVQ